MIEKHPCLTPTLTGEVEALIDAVTTADGQSPLNEDAILSRTGGSTGEHLLLRDGGVLAGYAFHSPTHGTAQLAVHPEHRRRGHGRVLLDALGADPRVWAFGDLPPARGLAAASGLVARRGLLLMQRPLTRADEVPPPEGVALRPFSDADAAAFLTVNAAAFAHHPEQGSFSASDLAARQSEAWWDPAGLILAEDAAGVVGFHWTKAQGGDLGEVYVLGVHPRAAGRGLGSALLHAGLAHLFETGHRRVELYVDADNTPAVRLYERDGFEIVHTDTLYGSPAVAATD